MMVPFPGTSSSSCLYVDSTVYIVDIFIPFLVALYYVTFYAMLYTE